MIISMVLQAVYNIISAFVSNINAGEMTHFRYKFVAGVGTNALLSRCLGMGDSKRRARERKCDVFAIIIYALYLFFIKFR